VYTIVRKTVGVVLKSLTHDRNKFSVFERHAGKVTRFFSNDTPLQGALISYFVERTACQISKMHILDVPFQLAKHDIVFLHHVLEICYYFLPARAPARAPFDLLMYLYNSPRSFMCTQNKKIFLFKLLVSFGYYADCAPLSIATFNWLHSESIDSLANSPLHLEIERKMDAWLYLCVSEHPQIRNFKTVHFLKKNKAL